MERHNMAEIIEQRRDSTGKGWETFVAGDCQPYFNYGDEPLSQRDVDALVAVRASEVITARKRAEIDAALDAEFRKRTEAATDLYATTGTDAVTAVFGEQV
jgi:hypothetical protein